jgi:regulator of protease activity HflC (stomatin/prohibitin superfamily)
MDRARACGLDLLRKVVDQHTLDQALSETGTINADIRKILDIATHEWGVEATLVELKDIQLPDSEARDGSASRGRARTEPKLLRQRANRGKAAGTPPPSLAKNYAGTYP